MLHRSLSTSLWACCFNVLKTNKTYLMSCTCRYLQWLFLLPPSTVIAYPTLPWLTAVMPSASTVPPLRDRRFQFWYWQQRRRRRDFPINVCSGHFLAVDVTSSSFHTLATYMRQASRIMCMRIKSIAVKGHDLTSTLSQAWAWEPAR